MSITATSIQFGPFRFDATRQELTKFGHVVRLSAPQLQLLQLFLDHPGQLISNDQIAHSLWDENDPINVPGSIATAVLRLRTHLGDDTVRPIYLETVAGLGYRFIAPLTPTLVNIVPLTSPSDIFSPETGLIDAAILMNLQSDPFLNAAVALPPPSLQERLTRGLDRSRILWLTVVTLLLLCALVVGLSHHLAGARAS